MSQLGNTLQQLNILWWGGRARGGVEWWKQADRSVEMQHPKGFPRLNSRAVDHLSLQKFMQGNKIKGTPQTVASVYVRER